MAAAQTEDARRELLAEAARWRAQHLDDATGTRRATWAVSRLHVLLGDKTRGVNEARQLMSLLQTANDATDDEVHAVRGYLASLGESAPRAPGVPRRTREWERERERERGGRREPNGAAPAPRAARAPADAPGAGKGRDAIVEARRAASRDDLDAALGLLEGQRGAPAILLRAYILVSRAATSPDPVGALAAVRAELGRAAGVQLRDEPQGNDPLSHMLGAPVPSKRTARIKVIEDFAAAHPERIDELAAAALRHHLATQGAGAPAPWLAGVVGGALSSGGELTRAALNELRAAESVAVAAYDEWPFERLVRLRKRAEALGYTVGAMRRGVLARGEPDDRKVWTLRLEKGEADGMIAVAPHAAAAYPPGMVEEIAPRLRELCARTVLLATGFGNAALRTAGAEVGAVVLEHDSDDEAILAALDAMPAAAPPVRERRADAVAGVPADLASILSRDPAPDLAEVVTTLRGFRRLDRALRIVQRMDLDDARSALVLRGITEVGDPTRPFAEAVTFALQAAARGPESRALVAEGGAASNLLGGGAGPVIELATSLRASGWDVHRVLRGPTKRESAAHPALDTLAGAMNGLWRLLVRKDDRKGEVWYVSDLPAEGRAGIPLLLLEDWQRVVVLPLEADLVAWWRTLSGPDPVVWTGSEDDALRAGVEEFAARAEEPSDAEGPTA